MFLPLTLPLDLLLGVPVLLLEGELCGDEGVGCEDVPPVVLPPVTLPLDLPLGELCGVPLDEGGLFL